MKKLIALTIGCAALACAQGPVVTPIYFDAQWCENIRSIISFAPPVCKQSIQVVLSDTDLRVTSFVVTINYSNEDGSNVRSQTQASPAHTSVDAQVGSVWFLEDVTNVKLISTSGISQIDTGTPTVVNQ